MEKVSNERVLQRAGSKREMLKGIRQRQMRFLGNVMRQQLMKTLCLTGKVDGRRGTEKLWIKFKDSTDKFIEGGNSSARLLKKTAERLEWRLMVANVLGDTALR